MSDEEREQLIQALLSLLDMASTEEIRSMYIFAQHMIK